MQIENDNLDEKLEEIGQEIELDLKTIKNKKFFLKQYYGKFKREIFPFLGDFRLAECFSQTN